MQAATGERETLEVGASVEDVAVMADRDGDWAVVRADRRRMRGAVYFILGGGRGG